MKKKKKAYKKIKCLDFGIFPGYVSFCYNTNYDDIVKYYTKIKADMWLAGIIDNKDLINSGSWLALSREIVNNKTKESKKLFYIIVPREFNFTDYDYAKLAHEVTHICQFYLPNVLNRDKEHEAEAYLHTHIMMQCLKVIKDHA